MLRKVSFELRLVIVLTGVLVLMLCWACGQQCGGEELLVEAMTNTPEGIDRSKEVEGEVEDRVDSDTEVLNQRDVLPSST